MQALPSSSLSNLTTSSRDGIGNYSVPCQSLISPKGSVSTHLDFVSLSRRYICNTPISCETSARNIKHKKQLAIAVCDWEYSRLSFCHPGCCRCASCSQCSATFYSPQYLWTLLNQVQKRVFSHRRRIQVSLILRAIWDPEEPCTISVVYHCLKIWQPENHGKHPNRLPVNVHIYDREEKKKGFHPFCNFTSLLWEVTKGSVCNGLCLLKAAFC